MGKAREFQLGLSMAGAISAGAYSAGVIDFLVQALQAWENARDRPETPDHRVGIKVIVGASAGAITGALGAVALAGGLRPEKIEDPPAKTQTIKYVLPNLYQTWVVKPCMVSPTGGGDLLHIGDISQNVPVVSVLNSTVLNSIADDALKLGKHGGGTLPYVASRLHVYLTLSNLRGVPYTVQCKGGGYGMMSHGDRAHYCVAGLGSWTSPSRFADHDRFREIRVDGLFGTGSPSDDWKSYALAAVTSGAFPIGLAARHWQSSVCEYFERSWPFAEFELMGDQMTPDFPAGWDRERSFGFTAVDGGLINNEPFEYARFTLMADPPNPNPREGEAADRAVIMIVPFPEPPPFPPDGEPGRDLIDVLMTLVPALRQQTQFKPAEVAVAAEETSFSRFMISPRRTLHGVEVPEPFAIACGLLGGFGGFLSRAFRDHDYQLGRRNCQKFLIDTFVLPPSNPLFPNSPADPAKPLPIIPLVGDAAAEVQLPDWPQITDAELVTLQRRIEKRVDALAGALIAQKGPSWFLRRLATVTYWWLRRRVFNFVRLSILSDLVRRDQIKSWRLPEVWKHAPNASSDDVRAVVAELLNPHYDLRTESGLSQTTGIEIGKVRDILAACQAEIGAPFAVWRAGWLVPKDKPIYTLVSRKPSLFWRTPVIRQIGDWFTEPKVDTLRT